LISVLPTPCGSLTVWKPWPARQVKPNVWAPMVYAPTTSPESLTPNAWVRSAPALPKIAKCPECVTRKDRVGPVDMLKNPTIVPLLLMPVAVTLIAPLTGIVKNFLVWMLYR